MVHRWATANLRGESVDSDAVERAGRRAPRPVDWLRDGAIALVAAITEAPEDVRTVVFLNDARRPVASGPGIFLRLLARLRAAYQVAHLRAQHLVRVAELADALA